MKYVLTCQDNLSKYFIAVPLQNQTADEVANAFVKNIIRIYCIPTEIVTDQGANFMSDIFKRVCKLFKIDKMCTTAYHPESNGALERTHKTLAIYGAFVTQRQTIGMNGYLSLASHIIRHLIQ
jgi:transposase InsO family protein